MQLTILQALQQGIAAHKAGKLQEAEQIYRAILQANPVHPDANHNLGILLVAENKAKIALPFLETALSADPQIKQFWISYIKVLITEKNINRAKKFINLSKKKGFLLKKILSEKQFNIQITQTHDKNYVSPSQKNFISLIEHYQNKRYKEAKKLAVNFSGKFPKIQFFWKILGVIYGQLGSLEKALDAEKRAVKIDSQDAAAHSNMGNTLHELGRFEEAEVCFRQAIASNADFAKAHCSLGITLQELKSLDRAAASFRRAIALKPDFPDAHYHLGITMQNMGKLEEAIGNFTRATALKPDYAEAHCNLGASLQELGRLEEAEASYVQAIATKADFVEAYGNLGATQQEQGKLEEAKDSLKRAVALKPDYIDAFWNLSGVENTIQGAEHWIDKCLTIDECNIEAKLTKSALRFYQGDKTYFEKLMQSEYKEHPFMRSFNWVFNLPTLPKLYFNRWHLFDAIIKESIISRPFYEFGVFRGEAFRYLIKHYRKGYGFDTFTGLPEDWTVGNGLEKAGTYSNSGNIPNIKGGEFIVGKFEDTLPNFYSEVRPMASMINFDADLYSSTLCALNYSQNVIDKDTILVFDEFLINESWEQDEFKALNEFSFTNKYTYEVIAVSFFSKQVAVKLNNI